MSSLNIHRSILNRLAGKTSFLFFVQFLLSGNFYSQTCTPSVSIATSAESICIGQSATYTVSGAVSYSFFSNPGSSPSFTATTGAVSPTTSTNYIVSGTNQFGCISSTNQIIIVNKLPSISVSASPTTVCVGYPSTLTANAAPSSTAHQYGWAHGDSSAKSVVYPLYTSTYTVTGTNTITGCQNIKTVSVAVFNPTLIVTSDTAICKGQTIALTAGPAISYTWSGGPIPGYGTVYVVSPTVATVYTVGFTSASTTIKCNSAKTISVGIYLQPTVTAVASPSWICKEFSWPGSTLTAFGASTYYWPGLNKTGDTVIVAPKTDSTYKVIGTDIYGCKDTAEVKVRVYGCIEGLNAVDSGAFRLFPDPADASFTLEAPGPMKFSLYTIAGQLVKDIQVTSSAPVIIITSDLQPGIYFLTGSYENSRLWKKIIVQRG